MDCSVCAANFALGPALRLPAERVERRAAQDACRAAGRGTAASAIRPGNGDLLAPAGRRVEAWRSAAAPCGTRAFRHTPPPHAAGRPHTRPCRRWPGTAPRPRPRQTGPADPARRPHALPPGPPDAGSDGRGAHLGRRPVRPRERQPSSGRVAGAASVSARMASASSGWACRMRPQVKARRLSATAGAVQLDGAQQRLLHPPAAARPARRAPSSACSAPAPGRTAARTKRWRAGRCWHCRRPSGRSPGDAARRQSPDPARTRNPRWACRSRLPSTCATAAHALQHTLLRTHGEVCRKHQIGLASRDADHVEATGGDLHVGDDGAVLLRQGR